MINLSQDIPKYCWTQTQDLLLLSQIPLFSGSYWGDVQKGDATTVSFLLQ